MAENREREIRSEQISPQLKMPKKKGGEIVKENGIKTEKGQLGNGERGGVTEEEGQSKAKAQTAE